PMPFGRGWSSAEGSGGAETHRAARASTPRRRSVLRIWAVARPSSRIWLRSGPVPGRTLPGRTLRGAAHDRSGDRAAPHRGDAWALSLARRTSVAQHDTSTEIESLREHQEAAGI